MQKNTKKQKVNSRNIVSIQNNIRLYIQKLSVLFGLGLYEIQISFKETGHGDGDAYADIVDDYEYKTISIKIYSKIYKESNEFIKKVILHELCHTITFKQFTIANELLNGVLHTRQEVRIESEESTSKIENILDKLLKSRDAYEIISKVYNETKIK